MTGGTSAARRRRAGPPRRPWCLAGAEDRSAWLLGPPRPGRDRSPTADPSDRWSAGRHYSPCRLPCVFEVVHMVWCSRCPTESWRRARLTSWIRPHVQERVELRRQRQVPATPPEAGVVGALPGRRRPSARGRWCPRRGTSPAATPGRMLRTLGDAHSSSRRRGPARTLPADGRKRPVNGECRSCSGGWPLGTADRHSPSNIIATLPFSNALLGLNSLFVLAAEELDYVVVAVPVRAGVAT